MASPVQRVAATNMITRKAVLKDRPQIIKLWEAVFGDDQAISERLLNDFAGAENIYVAVDNDKVIGQLLAVPCEVKGVKGSYLYALGTDPDYRSQGVMSKLMEFAECEAVKDNQSFFVLIPASNSLFEYYESKGFETIYMKNIKLNEELILSKDTVNIEVGQIPIKLFVKLREKLLDAEVVTFDNKRTSLELEDLWLSGFSSVYCSTGYAIFFAAGSTLIITEIGADCQKIANELVQKIKSSTRCNEIKITLPKDSKLFSQYKGKEKLTKQAQFKWWGPNKKDNLYIRYALDDLANRLRTRNEDVV